MGIILSRVRKKKSAEETLEKLQNDIKELEENKTHAQLRYKKITKLFLVYSLGLYIICGIIFYFHFDSTLNEKLLYLVPLALSPLLLYLVKRIISWYYVRLIDKNQSRLNEMKKEKKRILDEVMDKETYKVAKQILEKYSSDSVVKPNIQNMRLAPLSQSSEGLKKRIVNLPNAPKSDFSRPMTRTPHFNQQPRPVHSTPIPAKPMPGMPQFGLPAPILPLERSYVDKVVEYLIGDGPNNRYALICTRCHSHNGMALKEEFEYIGFKCCYCFFYNPARKIRPEAPRLETTLNKELDSDSDSKSSGDHSDAESKGNVGKDNELGEDVTNLVKNLESSEVKQDEDVNLSNSEPNPINDSISTDILSLDKDKVKEVNEETDKLKEENSVDSTSTLPKIDSNCDQSILESES